MHLKQEKVLQSSPLEVFPFHLVAINTNSKFTLRIHSVQTEDGGITRITHLLNTFDSSLLAALQEMLLLYGCALWAWLPFQKLPFDIDVSNIGQDVLFYTHISP